MKKANKALAALLALTMVTGSLAGYGRHNRDSRCWCICKRRGYSGSIQRTF